MKACINCYFWRPPMEICSIAKLIKRREAKAEVDPLTEFSCSRYSPEDLTLTREDFAAVAKALKEAE